MSDYKPTEYVVDFGDTRSSRFVELNMALIENNGAKLGERIVRCRDCKYADISYTHAAVTGELHCYGYLVESWDWYNDMPSDGVKVKPDGFCAWGERRTNDD